MRLCSIGVSVLLALGLASCSSPTSPGGTVTVTTAAVISPLNGAQIANTAQPVTLTIGNAFVTGGAASASYTFEIATDAGFANKIATQTVSQATGQTTMTLGVLAPGTDYYWHVRTTSGGTVGAFTPASKFTIGPAVVIQVPVPVSPANGATGTAVRPTLIVTNGSHTGPAGALTYRFDLATTADFSNIVLTGTVTEGAGQTLFSLPSDLAFTSTFFWRVQVIDATNSVKSPFSTPISFTTGGASGTLWSGIQPTGTNGHARLGDNWQTQTLVSFDGVRFTSPRLEVRQMFDLIDRGFDPQGAIDWMNTHGYPTVAGYYPDVAVIGFPFEYMALVEGHWNLVIRVGG
jgi:hypothetical protein